ncbi:MAG: NADP-dependent oxidoreductase [Actinomycetes bacterium]
MPRTNRQVVLKNRPLGMVDDSTTEVIEQIVPELEDGQALVAVRYLSIDPTIRTWMDDAPGYLPPIGIGEVIRAGGGGEVIESRSSRYAVGDLVTGLTGWQEFAIADEGFGAMSHAPADLDLAVTLNILGVTGMTAYFGLLEVGAMKEGDVVVVSGAAGATGSAVGQIARIKGASKIIGIAGGPEKCAQLVDELGFDAAIDYKNENVSNRLRDLAPTGLDLYFDNVGGSILDAALANLAMSGRVVLCGAISMYNETGRPTGPSNYMNLIIKRGRMEGFIVLDYMGRWPEGQKVVSGWLREGKMQHAEHVVDGLEHAAEALNLLFTGGNTGKVLVKVS